MLFSGYLSTIVLIDKFRYERDFNRLQELLMDEFSYCLWGCLLLGEMKLQGGVVLRGVRWREQQVKI
jgi:hypothetical protein